MQNIVRNVEKLCLIFKNQKTKNEIITKHNLINENLWLLKLEFLIS